jgi:phosphatidylserine/phosphatidylglycerophosphate/cardiolipin synthase-like enzyme
VPVDLLGAIVDMIAAARFNLFLAGPFWDAPTLEEIGLAIRARLTEGARVRLLGRFGHTLDAVTRNALAALVSHGYCSVLDWYEPSAMDPLGSRTFHLKAVIVDEGARAYLGTANLTKSCLRSRLEVGILLQGTDASDLVPVVNLVLQLAKPITEP